MEIRREKLLTTPTEEEFSSFFWQEYKFEIAFQTNAMPANERTRTKNNALQSN